MARDTEKNQPCNMIELGGTINLEVELKSCSGQLKSFLWKEPPDASECCMLYHVRQSWYVPESMVDG